MERPAAPRASFAAGATFRDRELQGTVWGKKKKMTIGIVRSLVREGELSGDGLDDTWGPLNNLLKNHSCPTKPLLSFSQLTT